MIFSKKGQQWDVLAKIIILLIVILMVSLFIIGAGKFGAAETNRTTQGTKDSLDDCINTGKLCSDVILDNAKTNSEGTADGSN